MNEEYAQYKELAIAWKRAAPRLRAMRNAEIRRQDNFSAIESLNSLFQQALLDRKPSKSSGFVEMYPDTQSAVQRLIFMRDLIQAAIQVQMAFDQKRWKYCFIGGLAVQKWGQFVSGPDLRIQVRDGGAVEIGRRDKSSRF